MLKKSVETKVPKNMLEGTRNKKQRPISINEIGLCFILKIRTLKDLDEMLFY